MISNKDKVVVYEVQIEDTLRTLNERIAEFDGRTELDDFEQGRQLAYYEIMDIIKSRHQIILDVLSES